VSGIVPSELDRSPASSGVSLGFEGAPMLRIMLREGTTEDSSNVIDGVGAPSGSAGLT
jgi:hypothetical protein